MEPLKRMEELIDILNDLNYHYYTLDKPKLSDREYDELYDELIKLEEKTGVVRPYSPSLKVGGEILDKFDKHTHLGELWSLGKAQTREELLEWDGRASRLLESENYSYVVEYKFDGLTLNLTYDNGQLVQAATRGNGIVGEAILEQVKTILNIPLKIPFQGLMEVQAEGLMPISTLKQYNKKAEEPLKNARNAAAGALRNLDTSVTRSRKLIAYCYNIGYIEGKNFTSHMEMLDFLKENKLPVFDYASHVKTIDEVIKEIEFIEENKDSLDVLTDGAVVKIHEIEVREKLGYTMKFPRWAVAYKFETEEITTILKDVVWNVGRTGKVTPSAVLEPVEIAGATVRRATLNNYDDILRKKVKINSRVLVRRSNEVIPEIMGTVEDYEDSIVIEKPEYCPACHTKLQQDGVHIFCPNSLDCRPQLVSRLVHFASRDAMNIEGFSEKTAEKLVDELGLKDIPDLYEIEYSDLIKLEGFKEKKTNNLLEAIESSKKVELYRFIYALGVPNVGIQTSREIVKEFKSLDGIKAASYDDLLKVKDVGPKIAESVVKFFSDPRIEGALEKLLSEGIDAYYEDEAKEVEENIFTNKAIVITGSLESYKRKELKEILESFGAQVRGSVSGNTDYLIVGKNPGSKYDRALKLEVPIIEEKDLEDILN